MRLLSVRIALTVATLLGLGLCASPLLGVHGVESALVLGVVLPPFVAAAAAALVAHRRRIGASLELAPVARATTALGVTVWAIPTLVLALDSLRIEQCDPVSGLAFMVLGPLASTVFSAWVGACVSATIARRRIAITLAALVPVVAAGAGVARFYGSPAIFVYGELAGWFPGTIYDEGVTISASYITFRTGSLALFSGILLATFAFVDPSAARPSLRRLRAHRGRALVALALLGIALAVHANGETLGHRSSAAFIADELGATARGERCTVHAPREIRRDDLARLADDCDFRVETAELALGVRQRARVTAFFFRSPEEKRRYMGAAQTYIAKPWRNEVYLQLDAFPHPVLFHEIVHVVAGNTGAGPFRVSGSLGGAVPDPALIEGVAVAAAWGQRDGLTPHEWAHAMLELELMPPLRAVFGLSFLGHSAPNAYTVAGSFIRFVLDEIGRDVVRDAYRIGDIEIASGVSLEALERRWHAYLEDQTLPYEALELARLRFTQPSIFSAVCPHRVAALREDLGADLAAGDGDAAIETCEELLAIDPADVSTAAMYAGALAHGGREEDAREIVAVLTADPPAPVPIQAAAEQSIADAAWRAGRTAEALATYRRLLAEPQSEASARQLEVRILAIESGADDERLVLDMLVGDGFVPASPVVVVHDARELRELRPDGLGAYLEARQLIGAGRYDLALPLVREAAARGLPTTRLAREQRRMLGATLFVVGELDEAERVYRGMRADPASSEGDRVEAADWLARITWAGERG